MLSLPKGIYLPIEFRTTFDWIQDNGYVGRSPDGEAYALMRPIRAGERQGCYFHPAIRGYWIVKAAMESNLAVIMRTGGDGSAAAIWRAEDGVQRFVHIGSGSGSTLACVLAEDPIDMLRLLAIGYGDLCWPEALQVPPADDEFGSTAFCKFVERTFATDVPGKASDIVRTFADMADEQSEDLFWQWLTRHGTLDEWR